MRWTPGGRSDNLEDRRGASGGGGFRGGGGGGVKLGLGGTVILLVLSLIFKRDLLTDTPYNTYTRNGLPPTPIAMPGLDALRATLNPAPSDALYFVARGDGSSKFSRTLAEHERAVTQYQRRGRP
jgi:cell division protein YceG involved in septum cleavage